ncbi:hypothetical protein ACIBHX_38270 [Nonomuraea sp. NPDC050536]|uniref:hypothetical protein n=1 Tax=Nonomuraea sp. NPDC050536 TaxID=3364366 RepID=UPI0037C565EA
MRRLDQVAPEHDATQVWGQRQVVTIEAHGHSTELRREVAKAQRDSLNRQYAEGRIGAPTLHRLTEEIDLRDPHATRRP